MNPIYLALDTTEQKTAREVLRETRECIGGVKIGLTFWCAHGPVGTEQFIVKQRINRWFLDLKLHDIPTQVAGSIRTLVKLRPTYLSIHAGEALEGEAMMRAAVDAAHDEANKSGIACPKLLGVTTLTHVAAPPELIQEKAQRIMAAGLDGIIASPQELAMLRRTYNGHWLFEGNNPILVTPGIRTNALPNDDQQRTATAKEAMTWGADIIVVGRGMMLAADRRAAAESLLRSLL